MATIRISNVPNDPLPYVADFEDPDTKARRQVPCATPEEAQQLLVRDCSWKRHGGKGVTVAQLAFNFLRRFDDPSIYAEETARQIRKNFDRHILPALGALEAAKVRPLHIQQLALSLRLKLQITTVRGIMRQLKTCYRDAIAAGYLEDEPVTEGMAELEGKLPTRKAEDLPAGVLAAMLNATANDARKMLVLVLMADLGLARTEVGALSWGDFRLGDDLLIIRHVLDRGRLKTPTRPAVKRRLKVTPRVREALAAYERELGVMVLPDDLLFESEPGKPLSPTSIGRWVTKIAEAAGVTCTPQQLRFHAAARWIEQGVSIVALAARLGLDDPLNALGTFRLLFSGRPRPRKMGRVSRFLFPGPAKPTRSSFPRSAGAGRSA